MDFIQHNLGNCKQGQIVEVTLGYAANVQLMDSSNFSAYKNGRRYRYIGGYYKQSPVRLTIPNSGHWYVAVDLGGHAGRVRSSARVLPGRLPEVRQKSLASIPSLVRDHTPVPDPETNKIYDVFVSHASEDKDECARPLAESLKAKGLEVWYDEFELRIGASLRRTIDRGISSSRFGVIVLSKAFFGKGWPEYELDGIVTRSVSGDQVLLPVWHNVTKQEVVSYSPSLADKLARSTTTHTVDEIASEIAAVIQETQDHTNQL